MKNLKNKMTFTLAVVFLVIACSKSVSLAINDQDKGGAVPDRQRIFDLHATDLQKEVFCFYYNWYGTPAYDGTDQHWGHSVEGSPTGLPGGDDIGSNYYPSLNPYSSYDTTLLATHMDMLVQSGINAIFLTWWGTADFTTGNVSIILDEAQKKGIKVGFQIEPYTGRSAGSVRNDIAHIISTYGSHTAFYRTSNGWPVFFVYDSYLIAAVDWADILTASGAQTIRNTSADAVVIGLWLNDSDQVNQLQGGFDGFYTYFGSKGFTDGSDPNNWVAMKTWADQNSKLFIPCVSPGYIDERIRPSNTATTRNRHNGAYYDDYWQKAIDVNTKYIAVTSFNEWHEGTQIEPAKPFSISSFTYMDYNPLAQDFYLDRTKHWSDVFLATP